MAFGNKSESGLCAAKAVSIFFGVALIIAVISVNTCKGQQQRQYLKVFNHSVTCQEQFFNTTFTYYNTSDKISTANVTNIEVFGMWRIGVCPTWEPCHQFLFNTSFPTYVANDPLCIPATFNSTPATPGGHPRWSLNVVRLGDEYQNGGALSLFPEPNYNATAVVVQQEGWNSSYNVVVQSYFFTGNHRWTLYEGPNYTGKKTCLTPSDLIVRRGYGFNAVQQTNFTVRSVKYTCSACHNVPCFASLLILIFSLCAYSRN